MNLGGRPFKDRSRAEGWWRLEAKCRGVNPGVFYPGRGEVLVDALAICGACPVRQECMEFAVVESEETGVWGGLSMRQIRRVRRRWRTSGVMPRAPWVEFERDCDYIYSDGT